MSQKMNLLKNVYLFKTLSEDEINVINEVAEMKTYNAGDIIFSEGSSSEAMYVINFGSVRIQQKTKDGDDLEVAVLGTGSHFGEMGFLDNEKRSASAVAIEKSDIVSINYDDLKKALESDVNIAKDFYQSLSQFLIRRLRITTNDLSFARQKNLSHF
ncbi:MAG: cyclic nucleotide-binding domain-containing protein [Bdellovibrionales bacterium]|nr:cyclic nucleotide-binding domain-containing protein [Bdellovibrionales bacterium]